MSKMDNFHRRLLAGVNNDTLFAYNLYYSKEKRTYQPPKSLPYSIVSDSDNILRTQFIINATQDDHTNVYDFKNIDRLSIENPSTMVFVNCQYVKMLSVADINWNSDVMAGFSNLVELHISNSVIWDRNCDGLVLRDFKNLESVESEVSLYIEGCNSLCKVRMEPSRDNTRPDLTIRNEGQEGKVLEIYGSKEIRVNLYGCTLYQEVKVMNSRSLTVRGRDVVNMEYYSGYVPSHSHIVSDTLKSVVFKNVSYDPICITYCGPSGNSVILGMLSDSSIKVTTIPLGNVGGERAPENLVQTSANEHIRPTYLNMDDVDLFGRFMN